MIEVEINKDIREYDPKVLFGMTRRQFIFVAIAVAIGGGVFALLGGVEMTYRAMIALLIGAPIALIGRLKFYEIPAEKFVIECVLPTVLGKSGRRYKTDMISMYKDFQEKPAKDEKIKVKKSKEYKAFR